MLFLMFISVIVHLIYVAVFNGTIANKMHWMMVIVYTVASLISLLLAVNFILNPFKLNRFDKDEYGYIPNSINKTIKSDAP